MSNDWWKEIEARKRVYEDALERSKRADAERLIRMSVNRSEPQHIERQRGWLGPALIGGFVGYLIGRHSHADADDG